jgi:hypothetical protein
VFRPGGAAACHHPSPSDFDPGQRVSTALPLRAEAFSARRIPTIACNSVIIFIHAQRFAKESVIGRFSCVWPESSMILMLGQRSCTASAGLSVTAAICPSVT